MMHMKYSLKRALALLIALLLAAPTFALAEEPTEGITAFEDAINDETEIEIVDFEPEVMELEDVPLEEPDPDIELPPVEPDLSDAGEPARDSIVTWCFIVDDTLLTTLEASDGDTILPPEDPAAPEGQRFAGWALEDGTPVFTDADGDGAADPVIAHPDPLCPEVNVLALFVAAEGLAEKQPTEEGHPTEDEPEEPAELPVEA